MNRCFIFIGIISSFFSCNQPAKENPKTSITKGIDIFEIYLEDSAKVNHLSNFLRDTLKLPVEWEPFDIFGNDVVYDAAFYLGNTTLELLSVNPPINDIKEEAKYNRILFRSESIDSTSMAIMANGIEHGTPFEFKIISANSQVTIGKQINLDPMSKRSNINVAFWQYLNSGYNFADRTIKGKTSQELKINLNTAMKTNPLGIVGLKEVHLSIDRSAIEDWRTLFGNNTTNKWVLSDGPDISYTLSPENIGLDWIVLAVQDLEEAKKFLDQRNILLCDNQRVAINPSKIYGLRIYVEE